MSRIAIIGGHGKIAMHLAEILTGGGHEVSSLFRNPNQSNDIEATGATPVVNTVTREDVAQVAALVLEKPETAGKFIQFNNGDTPIKEEVGS